jgi:hypothetical protein
MTKGGAATAQAAANNNTFTKRLEQLSNAWTNIFTSSKQATGVLGIFKDAIVFLTDNLGTVVSVVGGVVAAFLALKTGVAAVSIVTKLAEVANWGWNKALLANSASMALLGIPILAVVAGIALLISGIVAFKNNWDNIANADGFIETFKAVGSTIFDMVLMPLQKILEIIDSITGTNMAQSIENIRSSIGIAGAKNEEDKAAKDAEDKAFDEAISSTIAAANARDALNSLPLAAGASKTSDPLGSSPLAASAAAAGGASGELSGGGTKITSAAPKTFNLTIENLVKEINNNNQTIEENMNEAANVIKSALLGALNDVQTELN